MKQVTVSDELYDQLKDFIVDPFDDTIQTVIGRLIGITHKARDRWPSLGPAKETRMRAAEVGVEAGQMPDEVDDIVQFKSRDVGDPTVM
ncbi:MAG: hypothetical protein HQ546_09100 [Planctomycetes bacterium]|nr:hypothetical protein [Planctomycetota bacterium]